MEYTNEILKEMQELKNNHTIRYGNYYYRHSMSKGIKDTAEQDRFLKKSNRLKDCLNLWAWDKYEQNKLLDLKSVNRCCDNKFCPNCRTMGLAIAIHNFRPAFEEMLSRQYDPYLLTLTVPNVLGSELKETIEKMNKSFRKLWLWFEQPILQGYKGFSERFFQFKACVKVLEVSIEKNRDGYYHPHFHIILFMPQFKGNFDYYFEKFIDGPYQRKTKKHIYYSRADIHIMQLWKMAFDNIRLTEKNYNNLSSMWYDLYQCDIRPMTDPKGIYEVFKYTFKDIDIKNYDQFITLYKALENKRIRQGHGELYNLKLEEDTGEKQELDEYLEVNKKESPEQLLTQEIQTLIELYPDYRKISRFKAYKDVKEVLENN